MHLSVTQKHTPVKGSNSCATVTSSWYKARAPRTAVAEDEQYKHFFRALSFQSRGVALITKSLLDGFTSHQLEYGSIRSAVDWQIPEKIVDLGVSRLAFLV